MCRWRIPSSRNLCHSPHLRGPRISAGSHLPLSIPCDLETRKQQGRKIRSECTGGSRLVPAGTFREYFEIPLLRLLQRGRGRRQFFAALGRIDLNAFLYQHYRTPVINSFNERESSHQGTIPAASGCDMLLTTSMARRPLP